MARNVRLFILSFLLIPLVSAQQFTFRPHAFGNNLFAGGIDQPRFQFADIDGDSDRDLFILDRDERLWFYRNNNDVLSLEPHTTFGLTVGSWMTFVDIDHDGDLDCFTNGSFSEVSLFTNVGNASSPQFQLTSAALVDTSGSELFSERFSIPAFADIDGDGDLDFFTGGSIGSVSFYKNIGTAFSPQFAFITSSFGGINIQGGPAGLPKALHGASGIEYFDADSNGVLDLFWGDYFNPSLYFLYNHGTRENANIALTDSTYPNEAVVNTLGFNLPQHIDADGDGVTDLMIGSVFPTAEYDNFHFYKNTGSNAVPLYSLQTKNFIPMIDAGSRSSVTAADFDGDGDLDLAVASGLGTIGLYENTGTALQPVYAPVPTSTITLDNNFYAVITSGDLTNDGKPDLLVGSFNGRLKTFANTTIEGVISFSQIPFVLDSYTTSQNSAPCLADIDGDGDLDVLVGNSGGQLQLLKNTGSNSFPQFTADSTLTFIDVGNDAIPSFGDFDNDGTKDLLIGNSDGALAHYRQSMSDNTRFDLVTKKFSEIALKTQSAPFLSDLDGDGDQDLILGNGKGGLMYYQNSGPAVVDHSTATDPTTPLLIQNYPNPFNPVTTVHISIPADSDVSVVIYDMTGREIQTLVHTFLHAGQYGIQWDATNHPSGTYVCRLTSTATNGGHSITSAHRISFIK